MKKPKKEIMRGLKKQKRDKDGERKWVQGLCQ